VVPGSTVILNGNNSRDPENATLTYQWRQISGTAVALTNINSANPFFTAPAATSSEQHLVFELRVNDGNLNTLPDHVTINIPANGIVIQRRSTWKRAKPSDVRRPLRSRRGRAF